MHFLLEIDCDNAAFGDGHDDVFSEIGSILIHARMNLEKLDANEEVRLFDSNGNCVGRMALIVE